MNNRAKGIVCMLLSALSFSFMNVFVIMAGNIPVTQKTFFRNIIIVIITFLIIKYKNIPINVPKKNRIHMFSRCLFGVVGVICNFYAVDHMLLSDATMLNKVAPFFTIFFSAILIKEKATWVHYLLSIIAIGGCVFILKPTVNGFITMTAMIALCGGAFSGLAYTEVRILGVNHIHEDVTVFLFALFSCLVVSPSLILEDVSITLTQFGFLLLIGISATSAQLLVTASYKYAQASEVSVFDYTQIIFSTSLGYLFFDQLTDFLSIVGYIIIFSSAFLLTIYNNQLHKIQGR